ncbi:MAG: leucyl/phenylalanyl-tRNA--protein transferase [Deltaproteobacteria bacterium]|nr:leucyl/phenylalanyl-tRNA--protein transferase [Deltaproteobacteria bacterium]
MPVFLLNKQNIFPSPDMAEENGLLAVGGDLSPARLIAGYKIGVFPWFSEGDPLLWWFTSPRLVLFPDEFRIPRRLRRYQKKMAVIITRDKAFSRVIRACAEIRIAAGEETWIVDKMQQAYLKLHEMGYAHSVECWIHDDLAGGLYGVALDKVFFGESMFSYVSNCSKFALIELMSYIKKRNFGLIDCQMTTDLLLSFGARELTGKQFQMQLQSHIHNTTPDGTWNDKNKK